MGAYDIAARLGAEGLQNLARTLGILDWDEPPRKGVWAEMILGPGERTNFRGACPTDINAAPGDSVAITWQLHGAHVTTGMIEAISDKLIHNLAIDRVASLQRISGKRAAITVLTNDPQVSYPKSETVSADASTSPIQLQHHAINSLLIFNSETRAVTLECLTKIS